MFPLPFCGFFFPPDFEVISSCYKFNNYFRVGINPRIVVPILGFGSGKSGQRGDTDNDGHYALRVGFILSGFPCRLQIK